MGLISYLTTVRFDLGAVADLAGDLTSLKIARPLIVTDAGVVAAGLVERIYGAAPRLRSAPVFDAVPTNPTEEAVEAALDSYRSGGCDCLVAIGGGSPIDLAKAVALLATHDGLLRAMRPSSAAFRKSPRGWLRSSRSRPRPGREARSAGRP